MDLIAGLNVFVRVAETGSFSAVARETGTSQSAVTRQIAQLESHFGVRLLHRTTRKLSLTEDGQGLLTRARHLIEEAEDLEDTFGRDAKAATGLVRIGLSIGSAILLTPDFGPLLREHPGLSIDILVSEHVEDLIADRLDLAVRLGAPSDTTLVSRGLAMVGWAPVAAGPYLEEHGAPRHPEDLAGHACVLWDQGPDSGHWVFEGPDGKIDVSVTGPFRSDNSLVVRHAVLAGYGIGLLSEALIMNDIRSGRLYRLLPEYTARRRPAFVVYPSRRFLPQRTRVVIDFLVQRYKAMEDRLRDGRQWGENEATWLV
ncbi:MAG TPA: LysR family transcriptional regulator [Rhodopila sp.]|uniref:LysR family transcriptional regulator n=1 Tax=Rhodopila sp. TaxID=2480087 RepID=UPI002C1DA5E0|nr:LysR family transcriptional regulator [Rhodopila sp.]HVY16580.1 LysR family transcriptional regulator [Rhodopila sp.]